ncbi:MAG: hypothetical protein R3C53_18205 [Pirellulaceae bacterium]
MRLLQGPPISAPRQLLTSCVCVVSCLAVGTANAHPGHGTSNPESIWHYVSAPVHLVLPALVVAAALLATRVFLYRRRRTRYEFARVRK